MRNVAGVVSVECSVNQGNAAQVTFSLLQAQDSSGTGSKAIPVVPIFYNADTTVSATLVAQAAAVSFQTDAPLKDKIAPFQFDPPPLHLPNNFNHTPLPPS